MHAEPGGDERDLTARFARGAPPPPADDAPPADGAPPPPRADGAPPPPPGGFDPTALFVLLDGVRRAAPRELQDQLTTLIREFLLTLRSLIDWYLERLDRRPQSPEVEDIPID